MSLGQSTRAVCRIINQNSCGSGSICGRRGKKTLILTNAHVAGTRIGRIVQVDVEETGERIQARVIMAAYSDRTLSDWAVLETVDDWQGVEPVLLSKKRPTGSHYTKGFPRCRAHDGTDIRTVNLSPDNPLWRWEPDAIGGQSGSGVWSDTKHFQFGILTWQWGQNGAGQMTSEIYKQALGRTTAGHARIDGLKELDDYDFDDVDRTGCDDPIVDNGFFAQADITDLPIWAEDVQPPPVDPDDPVDPVDPDAVFEVLAEYHREAAEFHERWRKKFEKGEGTSDPANNDNTFGMP